MRPPRVPQRPRHVDPRYPEPAAVDESPPLDRHCDLVIAGGVTSGVVYPWAIVELARHYRFRSLGGTSVGAVAAAVAAAAEYGRCRGFDQSFEPLRLMPGELACETNGTTLLRALFQPAPGGQRLFGLAVRAFALASGADPDATLAADRAPPASGRAATDDLDALLTAVVRRARDTLIDRVVGILGDGAEPAGDSNLGVGGREAWTALLKDAIDAYAVDGRIAARREIECIREGRRRAVLSDRAARWLSRVATARLRAALRALQRADGAGPALLQTALAALAVKAMGPSPLGATRRVVEEAINATVNAFAHDLREQLAQKRFGFCSGMAPEAAAAPGFTQWMHEGIQKAAGLDVDAPPLTFEDLWNAPCPAGSRPAMRASRGRGPARTLDLRIVATNVTHGRPLQFPLPDPSSPLFYDPADWEGLFPASVLRAVFEASSPYAPASRSDPTAEEVGEPLRGKLRTLPGARLPIVVAARMSLAVPLLFEAVPIYAVDYESAPRGQRRLRRCWLIDGGFTSNFPIHLFDAAVPEWPTFGLWLTQRIDEPQSDADGDEATDRSAARPGGDDPRERRVWLPRYHLQGRADLWHRFMPIGEPSLSTLVEFGAAIVYTMKDWGDRTRMRLPQVRDRVVRIALAEGEGEFNLLMSPETILGMAHGYGTTAGRRLVDAFVAPSGGERTTRKWREHVYVRTQVLLAGLRDLLDGLGDASEEASFTSPLRETLARATAPAQRALAARTDRGRQADEDPAGDALSPEEARELLHCLHLLRGLEPRLRAAVDQTPYVPVPEPELRLRPPF